MFFFFGSSPTKSLVWLVVRPVGGRRALAGTCICVCVYRCMCGVFMVYMWCIYPQYHSIIIRIPTTILTIYDLSLSMPLSPIHTNTHTHPHMLHTNAHTYWFLSYLWPTLYNFDPTPYSPVPHSKAGKMTPAGEWSIIYLYLYMYIYVYIYRLMKPFL